MWSYLVLLRETRRITDMKILGSGGTGRVSGLCPSQPWRAGSSCATLYNTVTRIAGSGHSAAGNTYIIHTFYVAEFFFVEFFATI